MKTSRKITVPRQPSGVSLAAYPGRVGPFNRGILVHDEEEEDDDDDDDGEEEEDEDEVRGAVVARNGGKRIRRDLGNEWEEKLGRAGKAGPSQRPGWYQNSSSFSLTNKISSFASIV